FALSPPRETTAWAKETGSGGFDFGRAASLLTDAAARAGAAIMRHYHGETEVEIKPDSSPVTRADRDSEAVVLAALARLAPEVTVISEEGCGDLRALPRRFFLVDPLDGTKEFINKRSDFTVNIALIEDGRPAFGLVYAPARALLALTVERGKAIEAELSPDEAGADFDGLAPELLRVRPVPASGLTAVVSHSHLDPETETFLAKLKIAERTGLGSAVKFLSIARGEADVYPRFGPTMEWDTAAGQAVLEAAGGYVVGADGEPLRYGKTGQGLRNPSFIAWGKTVA
ncbi:MAG TPA: 3'(2'),5'-bisphosphate nucleotidase CysQ, partial [Methyloceanibacter sp.]|nr:3'(2'),5'-bisphosphate nucleotidase CysQ [Methyloceanibacter sp.]